MIYSYGNPLNDGYDYIQFAKQVAPFLPDDDRVFLHNDSPNWRKNPKKIPWTLFLNVCHWKSARPRRLARENSQEDINRRWRKAIEPLAEPPFDDDSVKTALAELTHLRGVRIPTASALLTAWNPWEFGIIDKRVATVLSLGENLSAARYAEFLRKLKLMRNTYPELRDCALRQIELALWHYFPLQEAGTKKRPDE